MNRTTLLANAEWHVREGMLRDAAGEHDTADYHREAAQEALQGATGRKLRGFVTLEELNAHVTEAKDSCVR